MVTSMTGFGRGHSEGRHHHFVVELRSVNHRFLDLNLFLPRDFSWWEPEIREKVSESVTRGRIDLSLEAAQTGSLPRRLQVDTRLALSYHKALEELRSTLGINKPIDIDTLAFLPDVFSLEDIPESLKEEEPHLNKALEQALEDMVGMRQREGEKMARQGEAYLSSLDKQISAIKNRVPDIRESFRTRLRQRIEEMDLEEDEERVKAEVIYYAERADVEEELTRLESHLHQMELALKKEEPVGRRLTFILQEINREANTIGSKVSDVEVGEAVVEIKTVSEQLRELVQNLE